MKLNSEDVEWTLASRGQHGEDVTLKSAEEGKGVDDAREMVLRGGPYPTEPEAQAAAQRWRSVVQTAFARVNVGADFGYHRALGAFTTYGLQMLEQQFGCRVLNDRHGILVFECEPPPRFVSTTADPMVGKQEARTREAIRVAHELGIRMTDQQSLAYDLYSASFFQPLADGRFVLLMMAIETLIEQADRSAEVAAHVDQLMALTRTSSLPSNEIRSILGSLQWPYKESVSRAGRKLAAALGDRRYMEETPTVFFTRCYDIRSKLVHGSYPRPTRDEIDLRAANLETFVSHLLSLPILDRVSD